MSRPRGVFPCAFLALSTVALASNGGTLADPAGASPGGDALERGTPALFSWADVDGDTRLDLAAVSSDGTLQLLVNAGEGRFEDVTERFGLAEVGNAALALWADYDGDGRLDLFVGAREGASRLFHNEGGLFTDMSAGSGLVPEGAVQSAQWLDYDDDGRFDLLVVTAQASEVPVQLFRGLEGGFFERAELPLARMAKVPGLGGSIVLTNKEGASETPHAPGSGAKGGTRTSRSSGNDVSVAGMSTSGGHVAQGPNPSVLGGGPSLPLLASCLPAIKDQANPSSCLQASSTPTLGRLYPISVNLFVAVGGDVGIGTTSPAAKLDVAGTARITDTLTLAPGGDTALNVSTGSIYKGGALFIHTKGGGFNTALGQDALASVTAGVRNTAIGYRALFSNTTGRYNTASGFRALYSNTTGYYNTATGHRALSYNTTGSYNTATGHRALFFNTTGNYNTASGYRALALNTTGNFNAASGMGALQANTTGDFNTASGARALYSNTTGYGNTAGGDRALYSNTTGYLNTAIGHLALRDNTTGYGNTATGYGVLRSNTTGINGTASGFQALLSNTTGSYNTASGFRALIYNTTGGRNTANGSLALRANTTSYDNTASGYRALSSNTTGSVNTASGSRSLPANTTGSNNTATGYGALLSNTSGSYNTASGSRSLSINTTGTRNTASGYMALYSNTIGSQNTASGYQALFFNTSGDRNIALGRYAGRYLTTGNDNIAIGNLGVAGDASTIRIGDSGIHTQSFFAGIRGVTTGVADAIPVVIDSAGQLGTVSSSRRFKKDIADMGERTERLLELRPVVFHYKQEQTLPNGGEPPLEYGLIAEEVAEIFPDLVVYDEEGKPFTVKYHLMSAMLLNELKRLKAEDEHRFEELTDANSTLEGRLARLEAVEAEVASLKASLASLVETH